MKSPTRACSLLFRHGATCGRISAKVSEGISFYGTRSDDPCNKYKTRGCLPWETEDNRQYLEEQRTKILDREELELLKKEYPMLHAVRKGCIPGCPVPGWQEINMRSKRKTDNCENDH